MNGIAVAGEVVTAGTALAGLILIYIGTLIASYGTYNPQEQKTVRGGFKGRAWVAFVGMALALLASALAIIGKWLSNCCAGDVAVWTLLAAFMWGILTAILSIREIK